MIERHSLCLPIVRAAAALGIVIMISSCAAVQETTGGWFGKKAPPPAPESNAARGVYYAGSEGLKVYSEPSTNSKVVGRLSLYERVNRSKLERGYAYVEAVRSGLNGWVVNSQLIWRLPATTAAPEAGPRPAGAVPHPEEPAAPAAEEAPEPAAPEATLPIAEPEPTKTPVAVAPRAAKPTPQGVAPSIFNPY